MKKKGFLILLVSFLLPMVLTAASLAGPTITVGVGGWAVEDVIRAVEELGFTEKTGIEVNVVTRPGAPPEFISQMTSAIMAGTSPYDVIDIEDEAAISFSRAGWLLPLNDLFDDVFWADWPQGMLDMVETWSTFEGDIFRIPHNYEIQYFWYRGDILADKGLSVPATWEEVIETGGLLTGDGVYAISDGLAKGAYLMVHLGYLTQQAGGNPYELDEAFRVALQYLYDLMHVHKVMPVAALNKDYDAVNNDYLNDRVVMMRQWPFFYDLARSRPEWFTEEKAMIALPPAGPAGRSTYAASWGWCIPTTADNKEAAAEFIKFMSSIENAPKLASMSVWWLSARDSVLEEMGDEGIAKYMAMYSEAGVVSTRPFHPHFAEASAILEDVVSAYLTDQISLDEAIRRAEQRMKTLQ